MSNLIFCQSYLSTPVYWGPEYVLIPEDEVWGVSWGGRGQVTRNTDREPDHARHTSRHRDKGPGPGHQQHWEHRDYQIRLLYRQELE